MKPSFADVGSKIRAFRKRKHLSLIELSQMTGIAPSNLSSIELNKSSPTLSTLMKIADAFGMKAGAFLDEAMYRKAVYCPAGSGEDVQGTSSGISVQLVTAGISLNKLEARIVSLEKGAGPTDFELIGTDRFVYCLAGRVIARVDDEVFALRKGDCLYLLPEAGVTFESAGSGGSSFLVVTAAGRVMG